MSKPEQVRIRAKARVVMDFNLATQSSESYIEELVLDAQKNLDGLVSNIVRIHGCMVIGRPSLKFEIDAVDEEGRVTKLT